MDSVAELGTGVSEMGSVAEMDSVVELVAADTDYPRRSNEAGSTDTYSHGQCSR